jgi:hypothetical protein
MSKADFALVFAHAIGMSTANIVRISSRSVASLSAHRPNDMRMRCDKYEDLMGLIQPRLFDEIKVMAYDYS